MDKGRESKGVNKLVGHMVLALVIILPFFLAWFLFRMRHADAAAPTEPVGAAGVLGMSIVNLVLGIFVLCAGIGLYVLSWVTNLFTLNFSRPVWPGVNRVKLRLASIFGVTILLIGLGQVIAAFLGPLLVAAGMPGRLAWFVPFMGVFLVGQYVLTVVNIWTPLLRNVVRARLSALGVTREEIEGGRCGGVSDPSASSFLKTGAYVEDDIGMFWIRPDALVYRGDSQAFEIRHHQLQQVERRADKGSVAAYAGARAVILHWTDPAGVRKQTRLHGGESITLPGLAKEMDRLAQQIEAWAAAAPPAAPHPPGEPPPLPPRPA